MMYQRVGLCLFILLLIFTFSLQAAGRNNQVTFGGNVLVSPEETMYGDAVVFGGSTEVLGRLMGDIVSLGGRVLIEGEVNGDLIAIGSNVELLEGSTLQGDAIIVLGSIRRENNVQIRGSFNHFTALPGTLNILPRTLFRAPSYSYRYYSTSPRLFSFFISFLFQLLLVLLITYFFPGNVMTVKKTLTENTGNSLLIGFIGLLVMIPLMLFLAITILGIPLALLTPLFYWLAIILGRTGIYLFIGEWTKKHMNISTDRIIATSVLGLFIYSVVRLILRFIPYIGPPILAILLIIIYTSSFGSTMKSRFGTDKPWFQRQT